MVLGASDVKLGNAGEYFRSGWSRFVGLIEALRYLKLLRDFTPQVGSLVVLAFCVRCWWWFLLRGAAVEHRFSIV